MVFEDEAGFSERPSVRRTWAPKGKTPIITSTGSWKTRTVAGAIACKPKGNDPRLFLRIIRGTMRAPEAIRLIKNLRRHIRGKVILIWDGLPAYRAKIVQEYLRSQRSWLTVYRFPGYAPELNPQEYVWASVRAKDTGNFCPDTMEALDQQIRKSGRRLRRHPDILKGCLLKFGLLKNGVKLMCECQ